MPPLTPHYAFDVYHWDFLIKFDLASDLSREYHPELA
jgi:hypothetical protein